MEVTKLRYSTHNERTKIIFEATVTQLLPLYQFLIDEL